MFSWRAAARLPSVMVSAAPMLSRFAQPVTSNTSTGLANALPRMRTMAPNAAAFTPAAMKPVTGVGAPSYASGAHMWKGTAATLNASAIRMKYSPMKNIGALLAAFALAAMPAYDSSPPVVP